jgi:uncharacterized RmlC-like cupin family protein
MDASTLAQIARLRLLVGFLGERSQFNWWPSAFFTPSSSAFLVPIFTKTAFMAQYHGVKEAASRVHDEHIGVGKVYHLFRLPEHVEQTLVTHLRDQTFVDSVRPHLEVQAQALEGLAALATSQNTSQEGPVLIGAVDELLGGKTLGLLAHHYRSAFAGNTQVYPYYADQK